MHLTQLLRAMKLLAFLLLVASLHVSAGGMAQKITLSLEKVPVQKVFTEVIRQTGVSIVYTESMFEGFAPVTIKVKNATIDEVLQQCFKDRPFSYHQEAGMIVINKIVAGKPEISEAPLFINITGRITNERGEPVSASIVVKGIGNGVTSNADGYFELKNVEENAVLVISGVSIETMEMKVNGRSTLNITVTINAAEEDAVTVKTNYWETSKRKSVGNVSIVTAKDIEKQPVANPLLALQGRMAGVMIEQEGGTPGAGIKIQIRGRNSIRPDGNLPLYVIDGVPFPSNPLGYGPVGLMLQGNPLSNINPADIENIQVLKDADVTAIYGSRGANGVVLITTKKGRTGKAKVDVSVYSGLGKLPHKAKLLNTQQYLQMRNEAFANDNATPGTEDYDVNGVWDQNRYTDWQKLILGGTASITNAYASITGGNENMQYLVSGNYYRETTVFPGDFSDQKYSGRFNIMHTSDNRRLSVSFVGGYLVDDNRLMQQDPTSYATELPPNAPAPYTPDGKINWESNTWVNPFAKFLQDFKSRAATFEGNSVITYEIIKGLQVKANFGYTEVSVAERSIQPLISEQPGSSTTGYLSVVNNNIQTWLTEPQLNYSVKTGKGRLSAVAGFSFQQTRSKFQRIMASGFASDALIYNLQAATSVQVPVATSSLYRINAFYGRINYEWDGKYLVNFTGRRDGSSRFGPGKQFANFGAVGVGWIFTGESFIQKSLSWLSFGKIRASYGTTGNDQIGDYGYYDLWVPTTYSYGGAAGLYPNNLFNANFAWEINRKLEAGLELAFLNDRITTNISYYRNRSGNQLVGYNLPTITGFNNIQSNLPAEVQNTGVELEFGAAVMKSKHFTWSTALNLTFPSNKLISYPDIDNSSYKYDYKVGSSLYVSPGFHYGGVDPATGMYIRQDVDGDGNITDLDWQFLKTKGQKYFGGFQNTFEYKGWQLDVFLQLVKQQGYDFAYGVDAGSMKNQLQYVLNRWQKPGDISQVRKFSLYYNSSEITDAQTGDASYIRLKNVSLSYRFPAAWTQKLALSEAKLFMQAQNLFTITSYKGLDPETQSMSTLPPLRIITAGIKLSF
jgi:TonB-dependent starch-binding outer membrane protein SusC